MPEAGSQKPAVKNQIYQLSILTSLYDDYAVTLLSKLDTAIQCGIVEAEIPCVLCNIPEHTAEEEVRARIAAVRKLKHLNQLLFFPSREFQPALREQARKESRALGRDSEQLMRWRIEHDRALLELLPTSVTAHLSVGYMQIISSELLQALHIINLHPAIPEIGPVGMWPAVMQEQAERPLPYLLAVPEERLIEHIPAIMSISQHKAGGMLHLATEQTDRGPVIAWYEFALSSPSLDKLWREVVHIIRSKGLALTKQESVWRKLLKEIRQEQFEREMPLIILALGHLSRGPWEIRDKKLYIGGEPCPRGYCLNREITEYLRNV